MGGRVEGRLERSSRTQTRVSNVAPGEYPDTAQAMVTLEFHTGNERRTLRDVLRLAELGATGTSDTIATKFCTANK